MFGHNYSVLHGFVSVAEIESVKQVAFYQKHSKQELFEASI